MNSCRRASNFFVPYMFKIVWAILVFGPAAKAETFNVLLPFIAQQNPRSNQVNTNSYIFAHLYYPLFSIDSNNELESHFFNMKKTKSIDSSFGKFQFCLRENIRFSDRSPIRLEDVSESLAEFAKLFPQVLPLKKVTDDGKDCLLLETNLPTPGLFRRLTAFNSTIIKKSELQKPFPTGLGPYKIESCTRESCNLTFQGERNVRFNKITFFALEDSSAIKSHEFQDLNHVSPLPKNFKLSEGGVQSFTVPNLKSYGIVFNIPDKSDRLCLRSILMPEELRNSYGIDLTPSSSFLPWPHDERAVETETPNKKCRVKHQYDYIIANVYNSQKVIASLEKLPLFRSLKIHVLAPTDFAKRVFSGRPYVGLISFDSASATGTEESNFSSYFEGFIVKENRLVTHPIQSIAKLVDGLSTMSLAEGNQVAKQAERILISEGWVLPLGRLNRTLTYPANVKINSWYDQLNGVPQIESVE